MIENLNKENFWNEMEQKYPEALNHFYAWIDKYKKEVNWDNLFGNGTFERQLPHIKNGQNPAISNIIYEQDIKFHDLPIEMQIGILMRYNFDTNSGLDIKDKQVSDQQKKGVEIELNRVFERVQHKLCAQPSPSV